MAGTRSRLAGASEAIWRGALARLQAGGLVSEALASRPLPPRPARGCLAAGRAVLEWARANGGTPALVLVSGGGSALAFAPAGGLSAEDKADAVHALMRAGATIQQL